MYAVLYRNIGSVLLLCEVPFLVLRGEGVFLLFLFCSVLFLLCFCFVFVLLLLYFCFVVV